MRKGIHTLANWLWLGCLIVWPAFALAQDDIEPGGRELFPMVDRQLNQVLNKAAQAVQEKDFTLALELLGPLVTGDLKALDIDLDPEQFAQDYFLPARKDRSARISLKREALRLLGSIPSKELGAFELQYGAEADLLLQQAVKEGDAEKLAEVARRFFHTKAGYAACVALGRFQLELGRPLAATVYLKRVVETPAAVKVEPEASILLAGAWLHAGQPDRARSTIANLRKVVPRPIISTRQGTTLDFSTDKDPLPLLEQIFGRLQQQNPLIMQQWTMFRGNSERNALTEISEPLSTSRWSVPILNDAEDEQYITEQSRQFAQQGTPSITSIQPLAIRDTILFRSLDRLVAIDFTTGKRTWEYHWLTPGSNNLQPPPGTNHAEQLRERIWQNAPYGQMSSDGELVFLLDTVNESSTKPTPRPTPGPGMNATTGIYNHLVAVSVPKQGSMVWSVGGRTGEHEPQLQNAFFLSPPLVVNGQLYALVELRSAIVLVALDRLTGKLQWKQVLVASEHWYNPRHSQRHVTGATLSYSDGILVCPTSTGVVVGVDLVTRSLAWATPYDRGSDANRRNSFLSRSAVAYAEGWLDSSATISQGKIVLTPPESGDVHCLDLFTGSLLWSKKREDSLFVAGVQQGIALIVGKKSFVGLQMSDGKKAWEDVPIPMPSGRGLLDSQYYLQPTADQTLVKFDIAAGKIEAEYATAKPLGNLIPYGGNLISLSHANVASFYRYDQLETKTKELLAKSPQDPWATARRGELQLHRREFQAAWDTLHMARKQPAHDPTVNSLLIEAGLALLSDNFQKHASLVDEIAPLLESNSQRERFYRTLAVGRESLGDRVGAFRAMLELSHLFAPPIAEPETTEIVSLVEIDRYLRVRSSRWLAAHAAHVYREANAEQRAKIDTFIAEEQKALRDDSIPSARNFIERFAFHPLADEVRFKLADKLIAGGKLLEAEMLIQPLLDASSHHHAARAAALHIKVLAAAERWTEAVVAIARLTREYPKHEIVPGQTATQFVETYEQRVNYRLGLATVNRGYPAGQVEVTAVKNSIADDSGESRKQLHLCRWLQENNRLPTSLHAIYNSSQEMLLVRDSYGQPLLNVNLKSNPSLRNSVRTDPFGPRSSNVVAYMARMVGHLLIISTGHEIIAFDALRFQHDSEAPLLWRLQLHDPQSQADMRFLSTQVYQNPWSMPRVMITGQRTLVGSTSQLTPNGICFFRNRQLVCVDPLSGESLWQRSDVPLGCELLGDEEHIYAALPGKSEAKVYRLLDGSLVGTRSIVPIEQRIATVGSRVLSWSQSKLAGENEAASLLELKLDDLITQKELWRETAPTGSRGFLCGANEVAILRPNGQLKIRSLLADKVLLEAQLEPESNIKQIVVLRSSEQYFVMVSLPEINKTPRVIITPAPRTGNNNEVDATPFAVLMTAKVYAFQRQTGKPSWQSPAVVSEMGLPMDQPLDHPILLFQRNLDTNAGGSASKRMASILLLDKRTGALIHREDNLDNEIFAYDMAIDRERPIVKVSLPQKTLTIRFTEDPAPPEPPLQSDEALIVKKGLSNAAIRLFNGIFPSTPAATDDDPFK